MRRLVVHALKRQAVRAFHARRARYGAGFAEERVAGLQLGLLNAALADARTVPFYQARLASCAARVDSLDDFCASVPVTTKADLQGARTLLGRPTPPDRVMKTGGSTGEPLAVGFRKSDAVPDSASRMIVRAWYGVDPADRLFLFWGHSHLMGAGAARYLNTARRAAADRVLGYCRADAYHLDRPSLRRAADGYRNCRPGYVLGYTTALVALADHVRAHDHRPKVVIATAEGFADDAERAHVAEAFGAPVAMEYGSVEAGLLAHEHPAGGYRTLWDMALVEALPRTDGGPGQRLLVTTLSCPYTPLLRYEIGDAAEGIRRTGPSVTGFDRLLGRENDCIRLPDGKVLHSELVAHAVREVPRVRRFQLVCRRGEPRAIDLLLAYEAKLMDTEEATIRNRLGAVSPALAKLPIEARTDLAKTPGGKIRWIVEDRA